VLRQGAALPRLSGRDSEFVGLFVAALLAEQKNAESLNSSDSSFATARPVIGPTPHLSSLQKSRCLRGSGQFQRSANVLWIAVRVRKPE
jgi:hypothetical protein